MELLHLIDQPCTLPLLCAYGSDGSQGYLPLPTSPIKKKAVLFICQVTLLISLERDAMYTHSCAATQTQGGKSSAVQHSRELLLWYARMYNGHSVLASAHRLLTSLWWKRAGLLQGASASGRGHHTLSHWGCRERTTGYSVMNKSSWDLISDGTCDKAPDCVPQIQNTIPSSLFYGGLVQSQACSKGSQHLGVSRNQHQLIKGTVLHQYQIGSCENQH